jgi:ribosome-binding protein aMBF1 (putative translation factor)
MAAKVILNNEKNKIVARMINFLYLCSMKRMLYKSIMKTTIDRKRVNRDKVEKLPTVNKMLDDLYGKEGTSEREAFKKEAYAYYTGQIIEQARKKAGMTQTELADKVGTNKSYISRVETGRTEPKVSTFYRIASSLGLSIELTPV